AYLAGAVTVGADLRRGAGGAARAVTGVTVLRPVEADLLLHTGHGLPEGDGQVGPQRGAPLGGVGVGLALAAAEAAEAASEEGSEDIPQVNVSHVKAAEAAASGAEVGIYPGMAELVI